LRQPVERYSEHLKARGAAPYTLLNCESDLRRFACWLVEAKQLLEGQGWGEVSYLIVRRYQAVLAQNYSVASQKRNLSSLRVFFRWMESEGVVGQNPVASVRLPKTKKASPVILNAAEIERLFAAPDLLDAEGKRDRALLEVLYATGLRVAECAALTLDDVNWGRGELTVRTGRWKRVVLLGRPATHALRDYVQNARPELLALRADAARLYPELWLSRRGRPLTSPTVYLAVKRCARTAGFSQPVTPQTLRHSCTAHLLRNGAGELAVRALLGHRAPLSLRAYLPEQPLRGRGRPRRGDA
jgi:site-specific recombinase XerD